MALIQLVEFKIVILVVMGSSPIGHPNRNPYDDMESRPSSVPWIAPRHYRNQAIPVMLHGLMPQQDGRNNTRQSREKS